MVIIRFTDHARMRMQKYNITEKEVFEALLNPDKIVEGYRGRLIAHKYIELEGVAMKERDRFRIRYSRDADILTIEFRDERPDHGEEVAPGVIFHYNSEGNIVEIEILDASEFIQKIFQEYSRSKTDSSKVLTENL